ncbi:MAG: hypothetical protein ACRDT6_25550 [Micromonosporaceae bacterium]
MSTPDPAPVTGVPTKEELRAASRAAALHRRRRYPDTTRCGLCGCRWLVTIGPGGVAYHGCFRRRHALELLDLAGLLDPRTLS